MCMYFNDSRTTITELLVLHVYVMQIDPDPIIQILYIVRTFQSVGKTKTEVN